MVHASDIIVFWLKSLAWSRYVPGFFQICCGSFFLLLVLAMSPMMANTLPCPKDGPEMHGVDGHMDPKENVAFLI